MNNRLIWNAITFLLISMAGISCNEDEISAIDQKSKLLAGSSGKSKSWKLTKFVEKRTGYYPYDIFAESFQDCTRDNIYTFIHDDEQRYELSDGLIECSFADPDIIESGNWFFDNSGSMIVIIGYELSEYSRESGVFSFIPYPGEIVKLEEKEMEINVVKGAFTYELKFTAIKTSQQ